MVISRMYLLLFIGGFGHPQFLSGCRGDDRIGCRLHVNDEIGIEHQRLAIQSCQLDHKPAISLIG